MHPKWIEHRNEKYEQWIRKKQCLVCGRQGEAHHVWHAKRNSYLSVPLCREHHVVYHTRGGEEAVRSFESKYNVCLLWEIVNLITEYIDGVRNNT